MKCEDCIFYEILCRDTLQENELQLCDYFKNKADYAEVKHGEWKNPSIKRFEGRYLVCSECDVILPIITELITFDFCPRCGAKMDGGSEKIDEVRKQL